MLIKRNQFKNELALKNRFRNVWKQCTSSNERIRKLRKQLNAGSKKRRNSKMIFAQFVVGKEKLFSFMISFCKLFYFHLLYDIYIVNDLV